MHYFTTYYPPVMPEFVLVLLPLIALVVLWSIAIKGFALWHAARNNQMWWFIAILVINTAGILEIVYLIWFRPKSDITSAPAHDSSPQ